MSCKVYLFLFLLASFTSSSPGGWGSTCESGGDARRLAQGCKFRILVSLRVFWAKRHHSREGLV